MFSLSVDMETGGELNSYSGNPTDGTPTLLAFQNPLVGMRLFYFSDSLGRTPMVVKCLVAVAVAVTMENRMLLHEHWKS